MGLSWNNATEPSDSLIKSIRIRIYRTVQSNKEHTWNGGESLCVHQSKWKNYITIVIYLKESMTESIV